MKKFIIKIFILILPVIILTYITEIIINDWLRKSNSCSNYQEWNDIIESKINADIIIQGSSRAWHNVSPRYLDSIFKINSYNLGLDGYTFYMQYYRFLLYLKYNKKPKYIIQMTDYESLLSWFELYMYEQFLPYLNEPIIRTAIKYYTGLDYKDIYFPLYRYVHNNHVYRNRLFSFLNGGSITNGKYKGFKSSDMRWDTSFANFKKKNRNGYTNPIDTMTLRLFDMFVKYCVNENIKLIFVNAPAYYESNLMLKNRNEIDSIYLYYSMKYSIPYFNYSYNEICFDTLNFYNSQHLNSTGVKKFNKVLANDLRKIIQ